MIFQLIFFSFVRLGFSPKSPLELLCSFHSAKSKDTTNLNLFLLSHVGCSFPLSPHSSTQTLLSHLASIVFLPRARTLIQPPFHNYKCFVRSELSLVTPLGVEVLACVNHVCYRAKPFYFYSLTRVLLQASMASSFPGPHGIHYC